MAGNGAKRGGFEYGEAAWMVPGGRQPSAGSPGGDARPEETVTSPVDSGLIAAAASLLAGTELGASEDTDVEQILIPAASLVPFTPAPATSRASATFRLVVNDTRLPMKIALQPLLPGSPATPYLYLSLREALLGMVAGTNNAILVPSASKRLASGEEFGTIIWPGDRIFGRIVGPEASKQCTVIVRRLALSKAINILRKATR